MMEKSVDKMFLETLVDYLNKRYEKTLTEWNRKFSFTMQGVKEPVFVRTKGAAWSVNAESGRVPFIEGFSNGLIKVWSKIVYEGVEETLLELYGMRGEKSKEIRKVLPDRSSWEKLKTRCMGVIANMAWGDEVAKMVSEKTGIKMGYHIPNVSELDETYFYVIFDSKGMGYDEKMRMIEKILDAMDMAVKEVDDSEKFDEFRRQKGYLKPVTFKVLVKASPRALKVGETVNISFTIKNNLKSPIRTILARLFYEEGVFETVCIQGGNWYAPRLMPKESLEWGKMLRSKKAGTYVMKASVYGTVDGTSQRMEKNITIKVLES